MTKKLAHSAILFMLMAHAVYSQTHIPDSTFKRYFIGSSGFVSFNLLPFPNPPSFYQLNVGYRLNKRNSFSLEAITWTYHHPLGIPYGPDLEADEYEYPGLVREFGLGICYQHFWWRGFYTALHATPFLQRFVDSNRKHIRNGFQLFTVARLGWHVSFFKNRFFIEPSLAATSWPIRTKPPEAFAQQDRKWPNYFLVEPGFHLGFNF